LPGCRTRRKGRRCDADGPDSDSRAPGDLARLAEITGELTRRLAEANVNVDLAYTTFTGGKIVVATDDVGSARAVLG